MPSCYFYAVDEDRVSILEFILSQADCRIYEASSRPNEELRCFSSLDAIIAAYNDTIQRGHLLFQVYSPSMKGDVKIRREDSPTKAWSPAHWSASVHGWGLIQLNIGGLKNGTIDRSDVGCNSEKRALKWEEPNLEGLGPVSGWDWKSVAAISSKIYRFIRKSAADKVEGKPVLPATLALVNDGMAKLSVY